MWKPLSRGEARKRTISASGELELLQVVLELDIRRCASKEAKPQRGWTRAGVPIRTLGLERGGLGGFTSIGEGNKSSGDASFEGGGFLDLTSVGEENETFL